MRHLIIGFTPFHAFFAERLIDHLEGEVFCLFTKGWPVSKKSYSRLGFFIRRNRLLKSVSYLLSFIYFTFWVRRALWSGRELHIYVPHPSNIFTNFVFFSKHVSSVNIYEDGLLNYYDADSSRGRVSFFLKLFAWLCGVPFKKYAGHLAGYDARKVRSIYVSRADGVVGREKVDNVVQLRPVNLSIDFVKGRVLFLDQDVRAFLSVGCKESLVLKMFEVYPPERYQYFYKGHHDYQNLIGGMVSLPSKNALLPAEVVVPELKPEVVVSFFSSALLNIVSAFPNIHCVALAAESVSISRDGVPGSLADIFNSSGVRCFHKSGV
ncbi:hypothetical protein [Pseudomonas indica]|uniref:hypothetical protein n=1 Tax=Pseudomonas indica TaxID=137658 RepID=UPI0023F97D99|nr:hypothetical protein [Pseudomonas indica]MBU3057068.1 hypothetical protein [Pseudomonas indica]